jgi:hypothetical protein
MLRRVRSLKVLTLKEPLLCTDRKDREHWYWKIAGPFVPDVAATFRTLEEVLLSVGEQCPQVEALQILPASACGRAGRLPLRDDEAAYTKLTRKCPRLVVLDPLIADQSELEVTCSLDVSTCIGTNLSSVTLRYMSTDALCDMLPQLRSLSHLRELKVVPHFPDLGGKLEDLALQAALQDFALNSPSELSSLNLVQTPARKSAVQMILAHCTKLRELHLDSLKFDGEWEDDFHIGHESGLPKSGSTSIRVLSWKQELVQDREKANLQVRLGVFLQNYPSLRELALVNCGIYLRLFPPVEVKYGPGNIAPLLTSLSFQNCSIGNSKNLSRLCPNLATLKLVDAYFSQRKLKRIPNLFPQLRELTLNTELSMRQPLRLLPPTLGPVPSVSHLELITNHIGSLGGLELLRFFPGLSVLRVKAGSASPLNETTAMALIRSCTRCERIRYLYVELRESESNNVRFQELEGLCPAHVTLVCKQLERD